MKLDLEEELLDLYIKTKDKVTNGTINPKETNNLIIENKLMKMPVLLMTITNLKNNNNKNLKKNKNKLKLKIKLKLNLNINLDFTKEVKINLNNLITIIPKEMPKYLEMLNLLKKEKKKNSNK